MENKAMQIVLILC